MLLTRENNSQSITASSLSAGTQDDAQAVGGEAAKRTIVERQHVFGGNDAEQVEHFAILGKEHRVDRRIGIVLPDLGKHRLSQHQAAHFRKNGPARMRRGGASFAGVRHQRSSSERKSKAGTPTGRSTARWNWMFMGSTAPPEKS